MQGLSYSLWLVGDLLWMEQGYSPRECKVLGFQEASPLWCIPPVCRICLHHLEWLQRKGGALRALVKLPAKHNALYPYLHHCPGIDGQKEYADLHTLINLPFSFAGWSTFISSGNLFYNRTTQETSRVNLWYMNNWWGFYLHKFITLKTFHLLNMPTVRRCRSPAAKNTGSTLFGCVCVSMVICYH